MGMTDAFDYKRADFSNLGTSEDGNICIGRILHKTHISVTETGTIAGAASAAEMFDYKRADFSNLGTSEDGNICIGRILHKTHISVTETGTIAGAASAAEMTAKMSMIPPEEIKTIRLDRPFLYMIIDCHTSTPVFLGVLPEEIKTIRLDRPFLYMIIDCHTSTPVFLGVLHKAVS